MDDLRQVGRQVIDAVKKHKPSTAGDLALAIASVIQDLRASEENYQGKLNHLEGLFRELVFGEAYELRDNTYSLESELDNMTWTTTTNAYKSKPIICSGQFLNGFI